MSLSLDALRKLVEFGLTAEQILAVAEAQGETATAPTVETVTDRKRTADRERMREKRQVARQSRDTSRDTVPSLPPPPQTPPPPTHPRVEEPPIVPQGDDEPSMGLLPDEPSKTDEVRQAFDDWNITAERCGLAKASDLTPARRRSIGKRLAAGGLDRWRSALTAVEASAFCLGQTPARDGQKAFKAHLDFVCQQSSFQKLIEGIYGQDAKPVFARIQALPVDPNDKWRGRVRNYVGGPKFWNTTDWEAAPGRPGCIVPTEVLREFGLEQAPPLLRVIG
jgi:hypothetical protein